VHGSWADGSSWSKVIVPLRKLGYRILATPIPMTTRSDDRAALDRVIERTAGPVILAAHAYAGTMIPGRQTRDYAAWYSSPPLPPMRGRLCRMYSARKGRMRWHRGWRRSRTAISGCPVRALGMPSRNTAPEGRRTSCTRSSGRLPSRAFKRNHRTQAERIDRHGFWSRKRTE
jgi:hypothetical protein